MRTNQLISFYSVASLLTTKIYLHDYFYDSLIYCMLKSMIHLIKYIFIKNICIQNSLQKYIGQKLHFEEIGYNHE